MRARKVCREISRFGRVVMAEGYSAIRAEEAQQLFGLLDPCWTASAWRVGSNALGQDSHEVPVVACDRVEESNETLLVQESEAQGPRKRMLHGLTTRGASILARPTGFEPVAFGFVVPPTVNGQMGVVVDDSRNHAGLALDL